MLHFHILLRMNGSDAHVMFFNTLTNPMDNKSQSSLPNLLKYVLINNLQSARPAKKMLLYYSTWLLNETEEQTKSSQHAAKVTAGLVSLFFIVLLSKIWEDLNKVKNKINEKEKRTNSSQL